MKNGQSRSSWSKLNYVYYFLATIVAFRILAIYLNSKGGVTSAELSNSFAANFIEWFGVLYSILLPLILVRVWEQLDDIDREFDREADTMRIFFEDLSFFKERDNPTGEKLSALAREYVRHVTKRYHLEVKGTKIHRRTGDEILLKIRKQMNILLSPEILASKDSEFIVKELFNRLNDIVDIRGDRIGFASQRLFETFRIVALIASIIFIVPFYIVGFTVYTSLLDHLLIIGVTLLVIFVYLIIEDFDEPFGGTWKIDVETWQLLRQDMVIRERQRRLEFRKARDSKNTPPASLTAGAS